MSVLDHVKELFVGAKPDASALEISVGQPAPDSDICKIELNREISAEGTRLFETLSEAEGWPVVQALLQLRGVHSVIVKGSVLILSKHMGAHWNAILEPATEAIRRSLDPEYSELAADPSASESSSDFGTDDLRRRIQEIIDSEINPSVAAHGGYIELLDVQGTRVFIHMGGGCQGCAMSTATLKQGVEVALKSQIPEISEILDTTDHAAGENPFFQPESF